MPLFCFRVPYPTELPMWAQWSVWGLVRPVSERDLSVSGGLLRDEPEVWWVGGGGWWIILCVTRKLYAFKYADGFALLWLRLHYLACWVSVDQFLIFFRITSLALWQSWWRHQMETFYALLALCVGNSPVAGEFPSQRPVTRSFDVFFGLRLNKRLSKQSRGWWFEAPLRPLRRHCNDHMITPSPVK